MIYLLDTNSCSDVLRGRFRVAERMQGKAASEIFVSAITVAEATAGALKSHDAATILAAWQYFLAPFVDRIVPFDKEAAEHYGDIRATLEKQGRMIGDRDCMIASIARSRGLTVVTSNAKEFARVPELTIENWRE